MHTKTTKERVRDAAVFLFFQKGFHATSTRDITKKINVNGSLISYHFKGKQGLLEDIVVTYYEELLECMERTMHTHARLTGRGQLKKMIEEVVRFKLDHFYQSVVVHRELTLDSTFVREMLTTYITKENYYLYNLFTLYRDQYPQLKKTTHLYVMQLKGMINSPFTLHHEWKRDIYSAKVDTYTSLNYITCIYEWIDALIATKQPIQMIR